MSFITLDKETGQVEVTPEAMSFSVVKSLYSFDKSADKGFFHYITKYTYHTYIKDHPLHYLLLKERKDRVAREYFQEFDWEKAEKNKKVQAFIDQFIRDNHTSTERFYLSIKGDLEELKEHIQKIPFTKKEKVTQEITVDFKDAEGNDRREKAYVDIVIDIDNSKAKIEALKRASDIITLEQQIREKISQEEIEVKKGSGLRLFDSRDFRK